MPDATTRYQMEKLRKLAQEQRELDKEMDDVAIFQNFHHRQNIESSEKLLHRLEFYHGSREKK